VHKHARKHPRNHPVEALREAKKPELRACASMAARDETKKSTQASRGAKAMRVRHNRIGRRRKRTSKEPDNAMRNGLGVEGSLMRRAKSARSSTRVVAPEGGPQPVCVRRRPWIEDDHVEKFKCNLSSTA